jgi:glutamate-5-semialdehyde dehydrogenase
MALAVPQDLVAYSEQLAKSARVASQALARLSGARKNDWLQQAARQLTEETDRILTANQRDLEQAPGYGLTEAQIDRLRLDPGRIAGIADGMLQVAALPDPVGEAIEGAVRPNGLEITKVRVPLGVVFFVYESRPNVTADAAAICVKSGNAVILRGGKEAAHSSRAIVDILMEVGQQRGLPSDAIQLVKTTDRAVVGHLLQRHEEIDVAIPRGGEGLIRRVVAEATMPVIKHFTGNCHVYVDQHADLDQALAITLNSKCQRMGVCNACESLLIHEQIAAEFLPRVASALQEKGVELRGDEAVRSAIPQASPATEEDFAAEYLGPVISVRVVPSIEEAITHINRYGSKHTDTIVTTHLPSAKQFTLEVDSAAVMVNASTRFHDGGEFGLGAEIGISTDKFHARGPCGLRELTTYKYVVYGSGQVR